MGENEHNIRILSGIMDMSDLENTIGSSQATSW